MSYENLYTGDLSRIAEQFKRGTWVNTTTANKERPRGIPGQVSIVASLAGGTPFNKKPTGFLATYANEISERRKMLKRRAKLQGVAGVPARFAVADEHFPPRGQAYGWYQEVIHYVPVSGMHVAKQIARLCGDEAEVTITWRSLAYAVGRTDKLGRDIAYTQRGVKALKDAGWLTQETIGRGSGAVTTFYLQVGRTDDDAKLEALNTRGMENDGSPMQEY